MKKIILSVLAVCAGICAFAQKPVVVVDYFHYSPNVTEAGVAAVRSAVIAGIDAVNRVNLIDVESEATLMMEANRRNTELAMEDKTARVGAMKTLGANYVITGNVAKVGADFNKSDDGSSYYNGNIVFSLTVVNVEDGTVVGTKNVTYSGLTGNVGSTSDEAIVSTLARVKQTMDNFVNEHFKLSGQVVEMKEASKKGDAAKSLYVSLGSDVGVAKGQLLDVFEVKSIAGREAETNVGSVKVDEVVAGDLSECSVIKGGKEIMTAFQKGNELRVKTKKDSAIKNLGQGLLDTFK